MIVQQVVVRVAYYIYEQKTIDRKRIISMWGKVVLVALVLYEV